MSFKRLLQLCLGAAAFFSLIFQPLASVAQENTAAISGRVTIRGKPAAGKKVLVADLDTGWGTPRVASGSGTQGRKYLAAETDAEGQYRFAGLPQGHYEASIELLLTYVPVDPLGKRSKKIELKGGEEAKNIDFALVPGGVITGRIRSADGNPVVGAGVEAIRETNKESGIGFYSATAKTDDRGVYRIYALPAGRYRVKADGLEFGPGASMLRNSGSRFPLTFHPGVTDESRAAAVEVTEGAEAGGVDINLGEARALYEVTGRAPGYTAMQVDHGLPRQVYCDSVYRSGPLAESNRLWAFVDTNDNFRLAGVASGRYRCHAELGGYYHDETTLEVKQAKISGFEIPVTKWAGIKGVVVAAPSSNRELDNRLPSAVVTAEGSVKEGDIVKSFNHPPSEIDQKGNFNLSKLKAGPIKIGIQTPPDEPHPRLLRIERNGVPIPNSVVVKNGQVIEGVRLVVLYGKGIIRGQVKFAGDAATETRPVVVYVSRRGDHISRVVTLAGSDKFFFQGLIDGLYTVAARREAEVERGLMGSYTSQQIRIIGGRTATVILTLNQPRREKGGVR